MKKLLGSLLLLTACEPPSPLIFELNFNQEVLSSPVKPTDLVISFCRTASGCERVLDFEKQSIPITKPLSDKETIAFSPGDALSPQELFFEFVLLGENADKEREVIASGSLTRNLGEPSYLKRQKIAVGLLPGASLQAVQDRTIELGTRVSIQNLNVHGVGASNNVFFAQAAPLNQFPASPLFSGLTTRGDVSLVAPLLPGDCLTVNGLLQAGENDDVELKASSLDQAVGCINSNPVEVSVNALQLINDPQPLDGVLLQITDVEIRACTFGATFFCAFAPNDGVEVELSNFIFGNNVAFNNALNALKDTGTLVNIVGVGEVFQDNLFLVLPRNLGDIQ